jgi:kynurenine formamidase
MATASIPQTDPLAQFIAALLSDSIRIVDLTAALEPATPIIQLPPQFARSAPFSIEEICRYDARGPAWYANNIACGEHTGTHFDAPVHWVTGKDCPDNSTHDIPVKKFIGRACVIDIAEEVRDNSDFLLTRARLEQWETQHGRIPAHTWLLIRTDWSKRGTPDAYLNMHEDGAHTPGFDPDCVSFLARERDILGVGVETVGTDAGQAASFDPMFPCHAIMHGSNKFGLASLINLDQLPPTGAVLIAAPLKIVNGSGSPLRVLALVSGHQPGI